jgi:molecular chaperone GrpE
MNKEKKNGKDIPVEYLEGKQDSESTTTEAQPEKEDILQPSPKIKKDKDKKSYQELQDKYQVLNDQFLRFRAEFANYKKRIEREQIEYTDYLKSEFIKKVLPVLDDFKHMLDKTQEGTNNESVLQGAKLIYEKLFQILANEGLEKIDADGHEFDPQIHEAMMLQKTKIKEENNKILSVFQEGYKIKEKLLRPSKVVVGDYEEE